MNKTWYDVMTTMDAHGTWQIAHDYFETLPQVRAYLSDFRDKFKAKHYEDPQYDIHFRVVIETRLTLEEVDDVSKS